jgi:phytol kinase
MALLLSAFIIFILLVGSEVLWRKKILRGENARKFVHIIVGTFIAFWPYFMSWREIQLMSLALLVVVVLSWNMNVFHAVHEVKRRTMGELFFPIGIGLAALLTTTPIIFTAAILHLSLADGFAALMGKRYGLLQQYKIGNYTKTLVGTITFWIISTLIIATTLILGVADINWALLPLIIWLPLMATVVENFAVMGLDNVLVPLLIIVVLNYLKVAH